jgi:hypothetical protein
MMERFHRWLDASEPIERIELIRILAPLFILGFFGSRIAHADEWLGTAGFHVSQIGSGDYRQPLYLPALPNGAAWVVAILLTASGLALFAGFRTRIAAAIFAAASFYVALADRLATFTVTKLAPAIAIALAFSIAGSRFGVDAALALRSDPARTRMESAPAGAVRFFQVLLPVFYMSSGLCKMRGDWLHHPVVLFTHLHDSYQTAFTHLLASTLPSWTWTCFQAFVLALETLAPLWFGLRWTRPYALIAALSMHAMIGMMFWPVRWFALLMMTLLTASFAPASSITFRTRMLERWTGSR